MKVNKLLKKVADLAEATAIKANGMTSWWDTYQPVEPKIVREMAEELVLLDFVTYEDGVITVTEKGKERVKKYAQEIPEEHAKAMGLI